MKPHVLLDVIQLVGHSDIVDFLDSSLLDLFLDEFLANRTNVGKLLALLHLQEVNGGSVLVLVSWVCRLGYFFSTYSSF